MALTEIPMPIYPARPEKTAPMAKPIALAQPIPLTPIRINITIPTIAIVEYCLFR